jgi:putative membrane protein
MWGLPISPLSEAETMKEKFSIFRSQFNWRMLLMRILMYAILLVLVVVLTPGIHYVNIQRWVLAVLITSIGFGIVSAIVRPIVQFFTLPFIFATYGFVVLLVNTIVLLVFNWVFSDHFAVDGILPALFGGLLITLFGGFLESMMGLTAPVVPDSEEELRKRIRFQDRGLTYALFQAAPAELQKYAPVAGSLAEPLPSSPDTQDAQAILDMMNATAKPVPVEPEPPPEAPPKRRRRLRRAPAQPEAATAEPAPAPFGEEEAS